MAAISRKRVAAAGVFGAACLLGCLYSGPPQVCTTPPQAASSLAWTDARTAPDTGFNAPLGFVGRTWKFRSVSRDFPMEGPRCSEHFLEITLQAFDADSLTWLRTGGYPGEDRTPIGGGFLAPGRFGGIAKPLSNQDNLRSFSLGDDRFVFQEIPISGNHPGAMDTAVFSARYGLLLFKHPRPGDSQNAGDVMWLEEFAGSQVPVDSLLNALREAMTRP